MELDCQGFRKKRGLRVFINETVIFRQGVDGGFEVEYVEKKYCKYFRSFLCEI